MFYRGTEVGCCAIIHEERKRGSKEASSEGNKQRQTGVCLPDVCLNLSRRRTNRHPHTPANIQQPHSKWWPGCSAHVHCPLCVFVHSKVSVPRCRPFSSWSKTSPCQRQGDTKRQAESPATKYLGWSGGTKRKSRGKRRKGEWKNRIIQLLTAVTGGQQQSGLRSLSASGGAIVFTSHRCRLLLPPPPFLLV